MNQELKNQFFASFFKLRRHQGLMTQLTPTAQAIEAIQPAKMSLG